MSNVVPSINEDLIMSSEKVDKSSSTSTGSSRVKYERLPWGALLLHRLPPFSCFPKHSFRATILILTFLTYTNYHMTRKVFSAIKPVLDQNTSQSDNLSAYYSFFWQENYPMSEETSNSNHCNITEIPGWEPFNSTHGKVLLGSVDYSWLFAYALAMFASGIIGDRMNLRYFLTIGLVGGGVGTCLVGVAYFARIHHLYYFILIQLLNGIIQSTGWPGVVAVMGNWFGKQGRGFLMGIWNAHTSVGNILGTVIPPALLSTPEKPSCEEAWGWSFMVPGFIMIGMGVIVFLFLITDPADVGLSSPKHHDKTMGPPTVAKHDSYPSTPDMSNKIINKDPEKEPLLSNEERQYKSDSRKSSVSNLILNSQPYRIVVGKKEEGAVGFVGALGIPGVIEFSLSLFFAKLVAYTFLFWLPLYVKHTPVDHKYLTNKQAAYFSTFFDVGGIPGGILAGLISDLTNARAITCTAMLYLSVPALYVYRVYGSYSISSMIGLLFVTGFFVNGPYALITTAVSSDLGTHKSLQNNQKAKATVSAIIDGTGSIGAALGPLLAGWISDKYGWSYLFYVLMGSCFLSSLLLTRLVITEIIRIYKSVRNRFFSPDINTTGTATSN